MEFVCYTTWSELPESADALFARAAEDSIFFARPWFENLVKHGLEDGQSMLLACVVDGDDVLAILPLMSRDGDHLHALGHLYTSLYTLLIVEHGQQDILSCLAQGLTRSSVCSLRLAPVAEDDSMLLRLQKALESAGCTCFNSFRFYNWFHRVEGQAAEDYLAARPSRVRNTIARKQRKLAREHGYEIRLYTGDELQKGMADFNAVYTASWKAKELFGDFIDGLAERFADEGWLRLAVLYIGGKPAAAQFWFVAHGKASIFKLAYDESWRPYSPGSILIRYLMEHVIDTDKVGEIDFLTGNDAYKQDWMSERRERWGLYCAKARRSRGPIDRFLDVVKDWLPRPKRVDNHRRWFLNP